jgi:hypothetical protein
VSVTAAGLVQPSDQAAATIANACEIDVVSPSLTPQQFYRHYYLRNRPVLIRGLADGWGIKEGLTMASVLARAAKLPFRAADIPYAAPYTRATL